jgi:acyl-CoA thioesterase-1
MGQRKVGKGGGNASSEPGGGLLSRRIVAGLGLAAVAAAAGASSAGAQARRPIQLVALGDSLSAGYGLPPGAAFPAVLEKAVSRPDRPVRVANAGVSGDTATGGLDRLDWSVPDGTDGVIVELGANDMLRGVDPGVTERAIDEIVGRLKARDIRVLLAGMLAAPNLGEEYGARFAGLYARVARKHGATLYPFFLEGVAGDRRLNLPDGLHPNAEGVKVIVERIGPTVERFLATLQQRA